MKCEEFETEFAIYKQNSSNELKQQLSKLHKFHQGNMNTVYEILSVVKKQEFDTIEDV